MGNLDEFSVLIDEVVVVAKGEGAEDAASDKCAILDCLKIYPLRYGIYDESREQELSFVSHQNGEMRKMFTRADYPRIQDEYNHYAYYPMPLRSGYVYVKSETDKGVYEYESVDGLNFVLLDFYGSKNGRSRVKEGTRTTAVLVSAWDTVGLLYSPVRLVPHFIRQELLKKDNECMQWINCADWSNEGGLGKSDWTQRCMDTHDAFALYPKQNDYKDSGQTEVLSLTFSEAKAQNPEAKATQRDLFFIMDDAWGIADQVRSDLLDLHLDLDALMRSLRTGVDPEYLKELLYRENSSQTDFSDAALLSEYIASGKMTQEDLDQAGMIHELAKVLYKYFNENSDEDWQQYIRKARKITDLDRLKSVLGVGERRAVRQRIEHVRYALELVLISDAYQKFCAMFSKAEVPDFYGEEITANEKSEALSAFYQMLLDAKQMMAEAYRDLSKIPHHRDKQLDLESEHRKYKDNRRGAFIPVIQGKNGAGKLLHYPIKLEDYVNDLSPAIIDKVTNKPKVASLDGLGERDVSPKLGNYIIVINTIIDGMQSIAFEERLLKVFSGAAQDRDVTKRLLIVDKADVEKVLSKKHWMVNYRNNENHIQRLSRNRWAIKAKSKKDFERGIVRLDVVKERPTKADVLAHLLSENLVYQGIMDVMFLAAFMSVVDENDPRKAAIHSLSFVSGVVAMQRRYVEANIRASSGLGAKARKEALRKLGKQVRVFGAVGGYISAFEDGCSAFMSYRSKDYDAMLCAAISSAAGASAATIAVFFYKAVWAGWVGLALALVAIAGQLLYTIFSDTEFEVFIKHTVFNKKLKLVPNKLEPHLLVSAMAKPEVRIDSANNKEILADYRYQMEEFIYCQAMVPFFSVSAGFSMVDVLTNSGTRQMVSGFYLRVKSSLAHLALNLENVEMDVYYVPYASATWANSFDRRAVHLTPIGCENDDSDNKPAKYRKEWKMMQESLQEENLLAYDFEAYNESLDERATRIFEREEAYVLLKIRFIHKDGHITPLKGSFNEDRHIFYLYRVNVERKNFRGRNTSYLSFKDVSVSREQVTIDTFERFKKHEL